MRRYTRKIDRKSFYFNEQNDESKYIVKTWNDNININIIWTHSHGNCDFDRIKFVEISFLWSGFYAFSKHWMDYGINVNAIKKWVEYCEAKKQQRLPPARMDLTEFLAYLWHFSRICNKQTNILVVKVPAGTLSTFQNNYSNFFIRSFRIFYGILYGKTFKTYSV